MQAPMARTWLILGRVIRLAVGEAEDAAVGEEAEDAEQAEDAAAGEEAEDAAVGEGAEDAAQAEDAAVGEEAGDASERVKLEKLVEGVDAVPRDEAAVANNLGAPGFTVSVAPPPRVTFLTARLNSQPDDKRPDLYPYIIAAGPFCLLTHFSRTPYSGADFSRVLRGGKLNHHLILVRYFRRRADGPGGGQQIRANAVPVPDRGRNVPSLRNIESVGLVCDDYASRRAYNYSIAELVVDTGRRTNPSLDLVVFRSDSSKWSTIRNLKSPLVDWDPDRRWVPHGAVSVKSTVMWFDLSWGILSCDVGIGQDQQPEFFDVCFYRLPQGRVLPRQQGQAAMEDMYMDIHARRCIAVSGNLLRYVEITTPDGEAAAAATVSMWSLRLVAGRWKWIANYRVRFQEIWDNESYVATGLPREIPVLTGVCPANPDVVYFDLNQRLLGVNVPNCRVVHWEANQHQLVNLLELPQQSEQGSSRYLVTWNLKRQGRGVIIGHVSPDLQEDDFPDSNDREPQDPKGKSKGKSKATDGQRKSTSVSSGTRKSPRFK